MNDHVDQPMSNVELRLKFADILSEQAELKRIAIDTHAQAKKTNGRVNVLERLIWLAMGALPLLTIWAGWLTKDLLDRRDYVPADRIQSAVNQAFNDYDAKVSNE